MSITYIVALFILLFLHCLVVGIHLAKHGEEREGRYNFILALIAFILTILLYYMVGMFDPIFSQ